MESKDTIYKYGHFYDPVTKKRLELIDGSKICIVTDKGFAAFRQIGNKPDRISSALEQETMLLQEELGQGDCFSYYKVLDRGSYLYFTITKDINHEFKVELLEDLYFYSKKEWVHQEERLYDCACVVKESTSNTIDFFEEVFATSLNEIYKTTFVHYFGNIGSPSGNAVARFYEEQGKQNISSIERYRKHHSDKSQK